MRGQSATIPLRYAFPFTCTKRKNYVITGDSRKYDTFRGKQAVLFINLLGKGLTQEINGDGGSI